MRLRFWSGKSNERKELEIKMSELEKVMYPEFSYFSEIDRKNDEYVIKNLKNREDLTLISQPEYLKKALIEKLKGLSHTYRDVKTPYGEPLYNESAENVHKLSHSQLIRVYLLMEALEKNEKLRNEIGELLERDSKDSFTEYGGLIRFDEKGELVFLPIESEHAKERDQSKSNMYMMPHSAYEIPHVAEFHLHAKSKNSLEHAGPSAGDYYNFIFATRSRSRRQNRHWIIVTKLDESRFNVDYLGKGPVVLDLGNYNYQKKHATH
jgi:hypothetical protein